jgi:GNAT superfamily N-acetyltransferase
MSAPEPPGQGMGTGRRRLLPRGKLEVTVTYLKMTAPQARPPVPMPLERLALLRAENCTVGFYRFLYNGVGEPWLWDMRRTLSDNALGELIRDPNIIIDVAYVAGVPAAFFELDLRQPEIANIAYFGAMPEFIGRRIGPWLLDVALRICWAAPGVTHVTVNTCTFDHPKALPLYQRAGFQPIRRDTRLVDDPRLTGVLPRHAAPHIPLARA